MKKSKDLIEVLSGLTNIGLVFVIVFSAVFLVYVSISLFSEKASPWLTDKAEVDVLHEYNVSLDMDTRIFFRNGETVDTNIQASSVSIPPMLAGTTFHKISYILLLLFYLGNIIFLIYQIRKILAGFTVSIKQGTFFYKNIHKHIQYLAYSLFAFAAINFFSKVFFLVSIQKIKMMDKLLDISVNFGNELFTLVFFGFLILVLAKVFKEGLKLKQESELTI